MPGELQAGRMPAEMRRTIEALRAKFVDDVEARILHIEAALADLRAGNDPMAAAETISAAAHRIAGLAPSLGFERVGQAAAEAERWWDLALSAHCAPMALERALTSIETLLDRLETTLDQ